MSRAVIFLIVLAIIAVVGGTLLLIGIQQGDDTDVDKNGVNSAPIMLR